MKSRLVASVALSALVLVGATGCTFMTTQSTKMVYSASDGVNVADTGPVSALNVMVIANDEGTAGNFVGALVNPGTTSETMTIDVDGVSSIRVTVPAGERVSFGADTDPLELEGFRGMPGSTVDITFESGGVSARSAVPVLDGTLDAYSDLAP